MKRQNIRMRTLKAVGICIIVMSSMASVCDDGTGPSRTAKRIRVFPDVVRLTVGETKSLTATGANISGLIEVTWGPVNNPNVTITKTGPATADITGVSPTSADVAVTATYTQGMASVRGTSLVEVVAKPIVGAYTVAPSAVGVVAGVSTATVATIPVTRTGGFTGPLDVVVSGVPAGSGLSVVPTAASFTGNAVTLNVSAAATTQPISYPITVRTIATGTTMPDQSTTLTVSVSAPSAVVVTAVYIDPRNAQITAPASLPYRVLLKDAQGNDVPIVGSGGTLTYTSSDTFAARIAAAGTGLAIATGRGINASTTISVTFTRGPQVLSDQTPLVVDPSSSDASHYGTVEISIPGERRVLTVGDSILIQAIVRDRTGIQRMTGVAGLTVTSANPAALEITPLAPTGSGYFFTVKARIATPLPGVEVRADVPGAAGSIYVIVKP